MATPFSFYGAYVGNETFMFTAPESNYYKFFAWGRSGNGGNGITYTYEVGTIGSGFSSAGGSGAGSGGFSASQVYLNKGETLTISISDQQTTVTRVGLNMVATAGGDGGTPTTTAPDRCNPTAPGVGGTASGGNIANFPGFAGGSGGRGTALYSNGVTQDATDGQAGENRGQSAELLAILLPMVPGAAARAFRGKPTANTLPLI